MNKTTAIHLAGTAVGRLLTASTLDIPFDHAVLYVDSETCCGPLAQSDVLDRIGSLEDATDSTQILLKIKAVATREELFHLIWSRMLYTTMGTAAEARANGVTEAGPIFYGPSNLEDFNDFADSCDLYGSGPEGAVAFSQLMLQHCSSLFDRPGVWSAVEAIAAELTVSDGMIFGSRIADAARPFLATEPELLSNPLPEGMSWARVVEVEEEYRRMCATA